MEGGEHQPQKHSRGMPEKPREVYEPKHGQLDTDGKGLNKSKHFTVIHISAISFGIARSNRPPNFHVAAIELPNVKV